MRHVFLLPLLLLNTSFVMAEYIDDEAKKNALKRSEIVSDGRDICESKNLQTVGEKESCIGKFQDEARELYPVRGTSEYLKSKYSDLSKDEAEQELIELQGAYEKAEAGFFYRPWRDPGVIPRGVLLKEAWWIQERIFGIPESIDGDPWFRECNDAPYVEGETFFQTCPLGKGGEK